MTMPALSVYPPVLREHWRLPHREGIVVARCTVENLVL